jgi:hypothetical protein
MSISIESIEATPAYTAQHHLTMWQKASIELAAGGQSYSINGRMLTRANWEEIQQAIVYWQNVVNAEAAGAAGNGNVLVRRGNPV